MYTIVFYIALIFLLFCSTLIRQQIIDTRMFVPIDSLRKSDICSIISIALPPKEDHNWIQRVDGHHSRRTMLYFLLSIQSKSNNEQLLNFIYECYPNFNWTFVSKKYLHLKNSFELYQKQNQAEDLGNYWQLKIPTNSFGPLKSREYISRYRLNGFQPNELKIYWNYNQIQTLVSCADYNAKTDSDAKNSLLAKPVYERRHTGKISFILSGIQDAVFQVPNGKQVIVLDFADERMPGGYYLENAMTQEEVILYNSDGYRALLDLKYTMMDGGYMLPEYGVAYIKRVRFFQQRTNEERLTDVIVAACYDLSPSGEGLYMPPSRNDEEQIRYRTHQKFQAIIASAVANTEGDGKNTYLLLGPIGTGAFFNDKKMIAELFFDILNNSLMSSNEAIRYAFEEIWFVSTHSLEVFENVFGKH
ncbi:unnamed protein product [Rotaria socialis]|uniref:Microbial-type PARG catalytic domain-containing protein n=1 Tax=Rotaria socialis TaxID=392032 RepID=A0A821N9T7_9BILA|nr:unnamed protein product [Rotaria socialis]CAF3771691.1 unnamed protein product [Rotaria socialis]CAF4552061.1 unnamed protein product [Rotaria socialis]CAF4782129.1 unnamed protein product [Rotaria socialis]